MATALRFLLLPLILAFALPAAAQKTSEPQPFATPGAEPPKPRAAPIVSVEEVPLPRGGGILVFGGTRGSGLAVVKNLVAANENVTVVTHSAPDSAELKAMGVTVARGDALDSASLEEVFKATPYRIVISAIDRAGDEPDPDFAGNKNVIDATKAMGIPRFILVSTIGAGDSARAVNWIGRWLHKETFREKTLAEVYLKNSGLEYTIVRPGGLIDREPTGQATLVEDAGAFSYIARADLGKLIAALVDDPKAVNKTYSAFDSTRDGFLARWWD